MVEIKSDIRPGGFGYIYFNVSDPVIAWMVYRGEIRSVDVAQKPGMVSWFLANTLGRHFLTIEREGQLESMRAAKFPQKLSRLTSLFAFPTLDDALRGVEGGHFKAENLAEIGPATTDGYRKEIYDKGWIDNYSGYGKAADEEYWSGNIYPDGSHNEALISGEFRIFGTRLRERAKATIWGLQSDSTKVALEFSRLAAYMGSDLGCIYPWAFETPDGAEIRYVIRWDDTEMRAILDEVMKAQSRIWVDPEILPFLRSENGEDRALFFPSNGPELKKAIRLDKMEAYNLAAQTYGGLSR